MFKDPKINEMYFKNPVHCVNFLLIEKEKLKKQRDDAIKAYDGLYEKFYNQNYNGYQKLKTI
jgi:hypothetical protein